MGLRIFIFALIFLTGCRKSTEEIPRGIISRDSMIFIMADIHIAEARIMKSGSKSSNRDLRSAYMQKVLTKSGVDTARFRKSFDYYSLHPEIFAEMYEDVVVVISKKQAESK